MPPSSSSDIASKGPISEGDRRVWVRYPSRRSVYCQLAAGKDGQSSLAHACDVSLGGIKLLSPHKFERGTILKIKTQPDTAEQGFLAEVRYATPMPDGIWVMGCAFAKELSEKVLLAWLA